MKKQIPDSLRKKLSAAGKKGWRARVDKASKVADKTQSENKIKGDK